MFIFYWVCEKKSIWRWSVFICKNSVGTAVFTCLPESSKQDLKSFPMGSLLRHNSISNANSPDEQFLQRICQYGLLYLLKKYGGRDNISFLRIVSYWNRCCPGGYIHTAVTKIYKQIPDLDSQYDFILFTIET